MEGRDGGCLAVGISANVGRLPRVRELVLPGLGRIFASLIEVEFKGTLVIETGATLRCAMQQHWVVSALIGSQANPTGG